MELNTGVTWDPWVNSMIIVITSIIIIIIINKET